MWKSGTIIEIVPYTVKTFCYVIGNHRRVDSNIYKVNGPGESLWSFSSIATRHFRCTYKLTLIRNLSIYFKDIPLCKTYIVVATIHIENLLDLTYELLVFSSAEELRVSLACLPPNFLIVNMAA